jgi:ABC-type transporter Mla MlaB component
MNKRKRAAAMRPIRRGRATAHDAPSAGRKSGSGAFALAAECTVADAESLKTGLAKLLNHSSVVTLDISAVQRIDTAGLQVITTFIRERESHGRKVQWRGAAPAVSTAAELLGLSAVLKLPTPAAQAAGTAP